ncbi:hypothetical protein SASPL_145347 [Salvia splendens]|uniref:DUF7746 domain-containing protein n=1 Tax=Salvia splendens TaxID=180675 RepID=A0A8X8Z823_SALSN|nr:hypothetical protein SASPL_145347 [Salvia splendens]
MNRIEKVSQNTEVESFGLNFGPKRDSKVLFKPMSSDKLDINFCPNVSSEMIGEIAKRVSGTTDPVIARAIIQGFTGQLKGWWDFRINEEVKNQILNVVKTENRDKILISESDEELKVAAISASDNNSYENSEEEESDCNDNCDYYKTLCKANGL